MKPEHLNSDMPLQNIAPVILRDMSITVDQFAKRLPGIEGSVLDVAHVKKGSYKLQNPNGLIEITCKQSADRDIGSLSIPTLQVSIDLKDFDASKIEKFIESFDQTFLKMGG